MQQRVEEVTSDDAKDKEAINFLKEAQQTGERAIEQLSAQAATAQKETEDANKRTLAAEAEQKAAEAAAAKAALERDEAKKQPLPHDVVSLHIYSPQLVALSSNHT